MLMIDSLVSWNVTVTVPSHPPLHAPLTCPFFPLLVTQHGHADGGLPAVPPEHLRCHTFPPADVDRWGGWSHAVAPDCPHVLLMCECTNTRYHVRYYMGLIPPSVQANLTGINQSIESSWLHNYADGALLTENVSHSDFYFVILPLFALHSKHCTFICTTRLHDLAF